MLTNTRRIMLNRNYSPHKAYNPDKKHDNQCRGNSISPRHNNLILLSTENKRAQNHTDLSYQ